MTPNQSPRKMPKIAEIRDYWSDPDRWTEHGVAWDERGRYEDCFACGWPGSLRCHILARNLGGSDDVSNIHILCPICHDDSEWLNGEPYWAWMRQVDLWEVNDRCLVRQGISKTKLYSIRWETLSPETIDSYRDWTHRLLKGNIRSRELIDRLRSIGIDIGL